MAKFQRMAYTAIDGILARGKIPLLVGGVFILGIAINLLNMQKMHLGDMLPVVLIPPLYF